MGYEQNCEMVEQLSQVNSEVVASHNKLEKSLGVVVDEYKEHREEVVRLGEKTGELVRGLGEKVGPLRDAVASSQQTVDSTCADLVKEVKEEAMDVSKKIRGSVEECLEANLGVDEAKGKLESTSGKFDEDYVEVWDDLEVSVEKVVETRLKKVVEESAKVEKLVDEVNSKLVIDGEQLQEDVKFETSSLVQDQIVELSENTREMVDEVKSDMVQLEGNVNSLLESGLSTYQPTGVTPARVERQFPRYLANTSPHPRILERFRKVVEGEEAARLPLDESVDSAISSDQSRASEGRERLGSTASMASSVTTTSDWDKEVGNQENNGIFAQPKPKKREIKKPEVIRRNILGSNGSLNNIN